MIDFVTGLVAEKMPTRVILENSGIGFDLCISTNTFRDLPEVGNKTTLKSYLHVREDNLQLYAFSQENERTVFLGLISVSGIGPRLAQTILSGIRFEDLTTSIQNGDIQKLTSISGVGKKTAERMVVELREKFSQLGLIKIQGGDKLTGMILTSLEEEALMALISLGYKRPIVDRALSKARKQGDYKTVEELIKVALQVI